ncbi:MAG: hypothetical protein EBY44_09945, partial [Actinobacteria bacterium]|nr:hypothetical protein [Actinomycetota bacterium]
NAVAMVCSFENQVFDQADDIWNIYASDDNTVTFYSSSGEQAAEEEDAGFFDDLVDFDFGGYQIDVEMPGPIVSVDGTNVDQTSETSFRIEAGLNDSFEAVVVSEDGSSSFPWVLLIVVGVAVLAVIALVAFLIGRSRSSGDSDAGDGTAPGNDPADADIAQPALMAATPALDSSTPPPAVEASPVPPAIESGDASSDDASGDDTSDDNSSDDAPADTADDSPGDSPADNDSGGSASDDND